MKTIHSIIAVLFAAGSMTAQQTKKHVKIIKIVDGDTTILEQTISGKHANEMAEEYNLLANESSPKKEIKKEIIIQSEGNGSKGKHVVVKKIMPPDAEAELFRMDMDNFGAFRMQSPKRIVIMNDDEKNFFDEDIIIAPKAKAHTSKSESNFRMVNITKEEASKYAINIATNKVAEFELSVKDKSGKTILNKKTDKSKELEETIDLEKQKPGIYKLTVKQDGKVILEEELEKK